MNRQSMTIAAALLATVVVLLAAYLYINRDGAGDLPDIPRGAGQAGEARGIIAEIEERRSSEETPAAGPARQPVLLEQADEEAGQPAADGAVARTPEPVPAASTGAAAELDEAYERAVELRGSGQLDDAQVLFFFGARRGHGPSAFAYAEMNDPLHHSPETSLLPEPDANAAYRWYSEALASGVQDAAGRLDALHEWVMDAAADGNFKAEQLLLQWEQ
jgi:hypothetical protein